MVTPRTRPNQSSGGSPSIGPVKRFGRYTLVKRLATGGMAEIWLARQRGLAGFNRFVVIKKILTHLSEQETFVKMFLDEARTSAQLNHPNVVQIYDLGREGESYYIAMEFIAGENLAAIAWRGMKRGHPFPPTYAARAIADGCKALHYAHHLKGSDGRPLEIVHRDISPQNILVTYEGEVKVVDFGIAKAATKSEHTKTGMLKGKFSYMSPEQCLGAPVDMRSDIFALGILLYELCTGKRLFKHESELMILEMITKRSVVPPSQVAPGISQGLEDIIMQALDKDVSRRFQTSQQMQIALEEYLRVEGKQSTNADIASYMRDLFADKIEEKRRLREIASKDDFEAKYGANEVTDPEAGRRVVNGLPPNQMRPGPGTTPGMLAHPQAGSMPNLAVTGSMVAPNHLMPGQPPAPPGYPPPPGYSQNGYPQISGQYPMGYASPSYAGVAGADPGSSWVARVVIAGALIVILVASAILYKQLNQPPRVVDTVVNPEPPRPPPVKKTGSLTLESVPQGATIYLDGSAMPLQSGDNAKTPSDLHTLQYGTTYTIKLVKPGYRPYEEEIVMGDANNGRTIRPELQAFDGKLIVEVRGKDASSVTVLIDGNEVGQGPLINKILPGNKDVLLKASLPGKTCTVTPARTRILPNETQTAIVRCSRRVAVPSPRPPPTTKRPPPAPKGSGGCRTNPDLPPGFVTISTTPYSHVYWNKRKLGETPLSKVPLPSGCVRLRAVDPTSGKERIVKVEVEPNQVRIFEFKIQ